MKAFILVVAGLLALVILGLLVGGALIVSMRVVAALRPKSDRDALPAPTPTAGEVRTRVPEPASPAVMAERQRPE